MTTIPVVRFVFGGKDLPAAGLGRAYTVVYDGQCKVCNRLVKLLRAWDRNGEIEITPSQNTAVYSRFPWIPPQAYVEAMQLIGPGGRTWQGAQAIEKLLDVLPRGGVIGWIFKLPYAGRGIDRFYRWFAHNRYRFGCGDHCQLKAANLDFGDK